MHLKMDQYNILKDMLWKGMTSIVWAKLFLGLDVVEKCV
jgi:hypothetical protein